MKAKYKRVLLLGSILVVLVLVAFLLGMLQGRSQVAEVSGQLTMVQTQLVEARDELAHSRSRVRMTQALARIYQTVLDLDDRNFGTANQRLKEAADLLEQAETHDPETMNRLLQDLEATDIEVAVDLASQRERVLALAERLRVLLAAQASPSNVPSDTTSTL